jgi:hypothetical protein
MKVSERGTATFEAVFNSRHRPKIVTLCGSTRFTHAYERYTFQFTMRGYIVLSVGVDTKKNEYVQAVLGREITPDDKEKLDELHLRKIDLSDEIMVLNVDGYVGESTREEIAYALATRKGINWAEPFVVDQWGTKIATYEFLVQLASDEPVPEHWRENVVE